MIDAAQTQQELDEAMIRAAGKLHDRTETLRLLAAGANPNARLASAGTSALGWLACSGDVDLMQLLIDHGADVNAPGAAGFSALGCAAMKAQPSAVAWLLAHGANPNPQEPGNYGVMLSATYEANDDVVRQLVEAGSDVNVQTETGNYGAWWFDLPFCGEAPLHHAMAYGSRVTIERLLAAGANREAVTAHGETAWHWAARHRRPNELMRWLRTA